MKVTVKSNVTFKKLKKANLEEMVFNNLILALGKEAKKKVDKSFKNNKDINGEPYEPLSYTYGRDKKALGKGGNPIMVFDGTLKKSISKVLTNKSDMSVTVKSEDAQMLSKRGLNYGAFHLTGKANARRKNPKVRKWFFTSDELKNNAILLEDRLLGKEFKRLKDKFAKKLQSLLKTRMRIIGSTKMPASSNFARNVDI
tara:strand:- start:304 stop:900 length:597 start_codon:yes stop_codon:yes gene_type:complete